MGDVMIGIPDEKYICCKILKDQFRNDCEQRGVECPDNVISYSSNKRSFTLIAPNAYYNCRFCPVVWKRISQRLN